MRYTVSEQFIKGEEELIAEFFEFNDSAMFVSQKLSESSEENKKVIYRIYGDTELLHEFNPENSSVMYAKYAENDGDIGFIKPFFYNAWVKIGQESQRNNIANFNHKEDATLFVNGKCEEVSQNNQHEQFFIYQGQVLIETLNRMQAKERHKQSLVSKAREPGAFYRPTPLPTRPTPPGFPTNCAVDEDSTEN